MLWNAARDFERDGCFDRAAALAYYTILSVFPLTLGIVALVSMALAPFEEAVLARIGQLMPGSSEVVTGTVRTVVEDRGAIGLVSLGGLLWSARAMFSALRRSLNAVWGVTRLRPLHQQVLAEAALMGMTLLLLLGSVVLGVASAVIVALAAPLPGGGLLSLALTTLLPPAITFLVFVLLYSFVPNLPLRAGDVWPGALVAALLFEVAREAFVWYVGSFASYTSVYGPLSSVVAFLVWTWVSGVVVLFGAEVAEQHYRWLAAQQAQDAELV